MFSFFTIDGEGDVTLVENSDSMEADALVASTQTPTTPVTTPVTSSDSIASTSNPTNVTPSNGNISQPGKSNEIHTQ